MAEDLTDEQKVSQALDNIKHVVQMLTDSRSALGCVQQNSRVIIEVLQQKDKAYYNYLDQIEKRLTSLIKKALKGKEDD